MPNPDLTLDRIGQSVERFANYLPLLVTRPELQANMVVASQQLKATSGYLIEKVRSNENWQESLEVPIESIDGALDVLDKQLSIAERRIFGGETPLPISHSYFIEDFLLKTSDEKKKIVADAAALAPLLIADLEASAAATVEIAKRIISIIIAALPPPTEDEPTWLSALRRLGEILNRVNAQLQTEAQGVSVAGQAGRDCTVFAFLTNVTVSGNRTSIPLFLQTKADGRLEHEGRYSVPSPQQVGGTPVPYQIPGVTKLFYEDVKSGQCGQRVPVPTEFWTTVPGPSGPVESGRVTYTFAENDPCPFYETKDVTIINAAGGNPTVTTVATIVVIGICERSSF